jgi:hypothetical protein
MINATAGMPRGTKNVIVGERVRVNIFFDDVHPGFLLNPFFGADGGREDRCLA